MEVAKTVARWCLEQWAKDDVYMYLQDFYGRLNYGVRQIATVCTCDPSDRLHSANSGPG